jgi:hypothetical protein
MGDAEIVEIVCQMYGHDLYHIIKQVKRLVNIFAAQQVNGLCCTQHSCCSPTDFEKCKWMAEA